VTEDADIERFAVEGDTDLSRIGRRLTFVRLGLNEVRCGFRGLPDLFVERSVERDRRARLDGQHQPPAIRRLKLESARFRGCGRTGPSLSRGRKRGGEKETNKKPRPTAEAVANRDSQDIAYYARTSL
jgi:hypothetical protein